MGLRADHSRGRCRAWRRAAFAAALLAVSGAAASAQDGAAHGAARGAPGFFGLQWRSGAGEEIREAHIYDSVVIRLETRNLPDGAAVEIEIWEAGSGRMADLVAGAQGTVRAGAAVTRAFGRPGFPARGTPLRGVVEVEWAVALDQGRPGADVARRIEENGYAIVDYVFVARSGGLSAASAPLAILGWSNFVIMNAGTGEPMPYASFALFGPGGCVVEGTADGEGRAKVMNQRRMGPRRLALR